MISPDFSEVQIFTTIEIEESGLVEVFVTSLYQVAFSIQIDCLGLIELSDSSLAILVLRLRQRESILTGGCCSHATGVLGTGGKSIVISLLYLLVEHCRAVTAGFLDPV